MKIDFLSASLLWMQIIFASQILVIRLAKTLFMQRFQAWLEYQIGKLCAKQTVSRTIREVGLSVIKR